MIFGVLCPIMDATFSGSDFKYSGEIRCPKKRTFEFPTFANAIMGFSDVDSAKFYLGEFLFNV